jgi:hypothetical protein
MALIKCPECAKEVSDKAEKCPSCAYPIASLLQKENVSRTTGSREATVLRTTGSRDTGCLIFLGLIIFAIVVSIVSNSDNDNSGSKSKTNNSSVVNSSCIVKETWGTYSKEDHNKLVEYAVNKELTLLQEMIISGRAIHLQPNTKIIIVDVGLARTEIRLPNSSSVIWVNTESVGSCN